MHSELRTFCIDGGTYRELSYSVGLLQRFSPAPSMVAASRHAARMCYPFCEVARPTKLPVGQEGAHWARRKSSQTSTHGALRADVVKWRTVRRDFSTFISSFHLACGERSSRLRHGKGRLLEGGT